MLRGRENVRFPEEQPIRQREPRRQKVGVAVKVEVQAEMHRGALAVWAVRLPLVQGQIDRLHHVLLVPVRPGRVDQCQLRSQGARDLFLDGFCVDPLCQLHDRLRPQGIGHRHRPRHPLDPQMQPNRDLVRLLRC